MGDVEDLDDDADHVKGCSVPFFEKKSRFFHFCSIWLTALRLTVAADLSHSF